MRLLDLFSGRWGWSWAFSERGWDCVGIDLVEPPEIPSGCQFSQIDILKLTPEMVRELAPDFICASSPCEQFSVHGMKHFHPNPPYPELGIKLFNHTRMLCESSGVPYVMENVRAAQAFVGTAVNHCGPFYLWGSGVPPLMNQGINKGFGKMLYSRSDKRWSDSVNGETAPNRAAKTAVIPPELSNCVADYAERILEAQ